MINVAHYIFFRLEMFSLFAKSRIAVRSISVRYRIKLKFWNKNFYDGKTVNTNLWGDPSDGFLAFKNKSFSIN